MHPEWLEGQKLPPGDRGGRSGTGATTTSTRSSATSTRNGTKIVKFFLHVSKAEQKRRFMARLDKPGKEWKFKAADVAERAHWDEYMQAYEDAITATSTRVGAVVRDPGRQQARHAGHGRARSSSRRSASLDLSWPEVSDDDRAKHAEARRQLTAE